VTIFHSYDFSLSQDPIPQIEKPDYLTDIFTAKEAEALTPEIKSDQIIGLEKYYPITIEKFLSSDYLIAFEPKDEPLPLPPDTTDKIYPDSFAYFSGDNDAEAYIPEGTLTPLTEAHQRGGKLWYGEGLNVIVIFPHSETFASFNKFTGQRTDWLRRQLSYPVINTPGALEDYLQNYGAKIMAETDTWYFLKFPSGSYLKVGE